MRRWATALPVSALLVAHWLAEEAGDRYSFSATLLLGFVAGVGWYWLSPRSFVERVWLWALVFVVGTVVGDLTGQPSQERIAPTALAMLGVVAGHVIAERFGWRQSEVPRHLPSRARQMQS